MATNSMHKGWFNPIFLSVLLILTVVSTVLCVLHIVNLPVFALLLLFSGLFASAIRIAEDLQQVMDRNTNPWGITCQTVGIKDIVIPQALADAMSRILIILFVALHFQACVPVQEKVVLEGPTVDKRVELLSIVFRLAEKQEYAYQNFKLYVDRIDQYFEKYKNHELIQFTKSIINERKIAFDGPVWLATHLDDNLNLLTYVKEVWQQDPRWTKENVETFVPLLQKFHKDTRFDEFFRDNADLYAEVLQRSASIFEQVDWNWFCSFFGKVPSETFLIKIGLDIWGSCYGTNVDYSNGSRKVYAIMGLWAIDNAGLPAFSKIWDFPILIHEFCHPFVDNLTVKNKVLFWESGERISSSVINEAYSSWEVVLDESLVNASMIKFLKDHDADQSEIEMWINMIKESFGFFWIEELVNELESYDKQRDKYPTLESYMPKLSEAYHIWASR